MFGIYPVFSCYRYKKRRFYNLIFKSKVCNCWLYFTNNYIAFIYIYSSAAIKTISINCFRYVIPLSITITAISTLSASFTTPFNFYFYASHYEPAKVLLQEIHISFFYLLSSIFLLLVLPLITGIALKAYFPRFIDKINKPVKISALLFFIALLMGAFITNRNVFYEHLPEIFGIICLQNFLAFIIGYFFSKLFKLPETHCRSISIETGIHNSGLGLILVMTFFNGNGGMALIAAWWGIWHIVTGGLFSLYWNKKAIE